MPGALRGIALVVGVLGNCLNTAAIQGLLKQHCLDAGVGEEKIWGEKEFLHSLTLRNSSYCPSAQKEGPPPRAVNAHLVRASGFWAV